jgi:hypothetical protein
MNKSELLDPISSKFKKQKSRKIQNGSFLKLNFMSKSLGIP